MYPGWIGLVLIVVCAFASAYTGAILGRAWLIVQSRNPQYQSHVVDPYPIIGEQAFGKFGRYFSFIRQHLIIANKSYVAFNFIWIYWRLQTRIWNILSSS